MSGSKVHIFVFGSNEGGQHGAGAALHARKYHMAQAGVGRGLAGTCYAIPTKDNFYRVRSLSAIRIDVELFINFARLHRELVFEVTRIGCGLAGYTDEQIAPMFKKAPLNCRLPHGWRKEYR